MAASAPAATPSPISGKNMGKSNSFACILSSAQLALAIAQPRPIRCSIKALLHQQRSLPSNSPGGGEKPLTQPPVRKPIAAARHGRQRQARRRRAQTPAQVHGLIFPSAFAWVTSLPLAHAPPTHDGALDEQDAQPV